MTLIEIYNSKSISDKQELVDSIKTKLPEFRETAIRSWCLGARNPKRFAKTAISKLLKIDKETLFKN